jgi:hypothetical protein
MTVRATVKNLGNTPATNVQCEVVGWFHNEPFNAFRDRFIDGMKHAQGTADGRVLFPGDPLRPGFGRDYTPEQISEAVKIVQGGNKNLTFRLLVAVSYRSPGGDDMHMSYQPFEMHHVPFGTKFAPEASIPLPVAQFTPAIAY